MQSKNQLLKDVFELAKNSVSMSEILEFSLEKGKDLAKTYHADEDIVFISMCLMDIKLKQAREEGKIEQHVNMAVEFATEFLANYDITKEEFNKIINGIEAHHGRVPYESIEAEICANADCYIFIHAKGVFLYSGLMARRTNDLKEQITQLKSKLYEKYKLISLEKAKEDLESDYQMFSILFDKILKDYDLES